MSYVQRDSNGKIKGVYANLQPGYAEEFLPDNNAEIVAYLTPKPVPKQLSIEDLSALLVSKGVVTQTDIDGKKK